MVSVSFAVEGSEQRTGRTLARWANSLHDLTPIWPEVAELFRRAELRHFVTQGEPDPWVPLSPRYAAWKERAHPGKPILVLSGALRRDMTTRPYAEERYEPYRMTLTPTRLPYARFHQDGTPRMPQRKVINLSEQEWTGIVKTIQRYVVEYERGETGMFGVGQ